MTTGKFIFSLLLFWRVDQIFKIRIYGLIGCFFLRIKGVLVDLLQGFFV